MSRSRSAGSAAADAVLQATTSSLIRRASSSSATSSENASISPRSRGPYGTRAESAKYTKSSCGNWTSSSCSTVRPPTPESNTPTGRRRSASGDGGAGGATTPPVWPGRRAPRSAHARLTPPPRSPSPPASGLAHAVDRGLELVDDRLDDRGVLEVPAGGHDAGQQHREQQHQPDVLDR